jgi:hypothetical protein|tara:strand:- start:101 stop:625 length:525 start_codon:yes stop_codon:yes gene_type:complete
MSGKADKADPDALTARQVAFARGVFEGKARTLAEAYRAAYDVSGTSPAQKKAQANEASRLWKHPGVRAWVDRARREVDLRNARRAVGEREAIRTRLWAEVDGDHAPSRLQALRLLGLECGMFREVNKLEVETNAATMSDAEVIAEIESTLREQQQDRSDPIDVVDITPKKKELH